MFHIQSVCKKHYLIFMAFVFCEAAWARPNVTFCFENKTYPPYLFTNQHGQPAGVLIDKIIKGAARAGIQAEFVTSPWLRCQKKVEQNDAQALFAMIKTSQRANRFQFPANHLHYMVLAEYPVFYHQSSIFAQHLNDIFVLNQFNPMAYKKVQHFGLQAPMGYVAQNYLKRYDLQATFEYSVEQGLRQVAKNRLDGYIVERQIGENKLIKLGIEQQVQVSAGVVIQQAWYVPFNKDFYQQNMALVDDFWLAISDKDESTSL